MATKKPAAAKPAPAAPATKTPGTAVMPWEEQMAGIAAKASSAEKLGGDYAKNIGTQSGVMTIDDEPVEGNEMRLVVVASLHKNTLYPGPYDPKNKTVPKCYAYGDESAEDPEDSMKPHEKVAEPEGDENGLCKACWANEFGSADTGRGKACKNTRSLAVITEDALESVEALAAAEVRGLSVPVMSVKLWSKFVKSLEENFQRPCFGVICTVKLVPDAKSQFLITFKFEELIDFTQELWTAMLAKRDEALAAMAVPYPTPEEFAEMQAAKAPAKVQPRGKLAAVLAKGKPAAPVAKSRKF